MENLKRVDVKLTKETLAWAAFRASELGISRRSFLATVVEKERLHDMTSSPTVFPSSILYSVKKDNK